MFESHHSLPITSRSPRGKQPLRTLQWFEVETSRTVPVMAIIDVSDALRQDFWL